jgi:DNA polymerase-3 subunit epsilon
MINLGFLALVGGSMNFIAFDIETTGLIPGVDQITEIAAVKFSNGEAVELFSTLVDPQRPIPEDAQRIAGITDEMVAGKPKIEDLLESFAEFCGDTTIIAHNANFDYQFVNSDIKKHETSAPRGFVLDTLALSRKIIPGLMNYKLGTLVQHLKIQSNVFHRAQHDATYCGHLFLNLLNKMSVNTQPPALETLIQISGKPLKFAQIVKREKQLDLLSLI